jgi:alpha/beta superfamily hydrolase
MPNSLLERLGVLTAKIDAAHARVDKIESSTSQDLGEIKKDVKLLLAWMNRSLGWAAALMFVGGSLGGLVGFILTKLIK